MKYTVSVARTSVRLRDIEVEAESEEAAVDKALDVAGNYNFNDGQDLGVEYDVHFVNGEE